MALEPTQHNNSNACVYCGDSPISHGYSYFGTIMYLLFEPISNTTNHLITKWLRFQVEKLLRLFLLILINLRVVTFSSDPDKATTFRSRMIWDEAIKRGILMRQLKVFGKYTDNYEAYLGKKRIFFDSLPIPSRLIDFDNNWDDKFFLKKKLNEINVPVPQCINVPLFVHKNEMIFNQLVKPLIVKPKAGSRGRHTTTNIHTLKELDEAITIAEQISPTVVVEEHLDGYICRATCIDGELVGFYRADAPYVIGDGVHTLRDLIAMKNQTKHEKVGVVQMNKEIENFLARSGFSLDSVIEQGIKVKLTHRTGRFFGGETKEMLPNLHPDFIPIIERAARMTKLPIAGFDVIVPNPEALPNSQKWGIIECNTLPFIDLHYFALEGKPSKNIAGHIWDLWNKK